MTLLGKVAGFLDSAAERIEKFEVDLNAALEAEKAKQKIEAERAARVRPSAAKPAEDGKEPTVRVGVSLDKETGVETPVEAKLSDLFANRLTTYTVGRGKSSSPVLDSAEFARRVKAYVELVSQQGREVAEQAKASTPDAPTVDITGFRKRLKEDIARRVEESIAAARQADVKDSPEAKKVPAEIRINVIKDKTSGTSKVAVDKASSADANAKTREYHRTQSSALLTRLANDDLAPGETPEFLIEMIKTHIRIADDLAGK